VLLAQLFDRYNINELVVPGFPALFEAFFIQEELTKIYAPNVFQALVRPHSYATPGSSCHWHIQIERRMIFQTIDFLTWLYLGNNGNRNAKLCVALVHNTVFSRRCPLPNIAPDMGYIATRGL
jgi:hypothetical protein